MQSRYCNTVADASDAPKDRLQYSLPSNPNVGSKTPSSHGGSTPGCIFDTLETPNLDSQINFIGTEFYDPFITSPRWSADRTWTSIEDRVISDLSFEVKNVNPKELDPEWENDDIDEVMVLSRKIKRKPLSVIMEGSEAHTFDSSKGKRVASSDFELLHIIRVNHTGDIYLGRKNDTSALFSVKMTKKAPYMSSDSVLYMRTEQAVLRLLTERRVSSMVRLHWSFEDEQSLYLVMDACAGGTLRGWIANNGPLQPKLAIACATELVGGLCALHAAGIIHRDLKPESLQIGKDGHILITDFGCARLLTHFRQTSDEGDASLACGTREFQAPEIILGWAHDYAVDWWSFGLVMHAMLTGEHPFTDVIGITRPSVLQARILYNDSRSSARSPVDSTASDLITKCLQRNPALRLDVRGIKTHGYFAHVNWADVLEGRMSAPFKLQDPEQSTSYHGREKATVSPRSRDHRRLGSGAFSFSWAQDNSSIYSLGDANLTGLQTDPGTTYSRTSGEVNSSSLGTGNKSPFSTHLANLDRRATAANGSIPSEFGGRQDGMPKVCDRIGTLRKYSSLNFSLDTLASAPSFEPEDGPSQTVPDKLRKSSSTHCTSPFSDPEGPSNSPRPQNKLRKKSRPDSTPILQSAPVLELPQGVEQIGNGIAYTRRTDLQNTRLTMASLTPRTCHAFFSSGRFHGLTPKLNKKKTASDRKDQAQPSKGGAVMNGNDESEDAMDAVMREIYGSNWNVGLSATELPGTGASPRGYPVSAKFGATPRAGLGWAESALTRYATPPADASTLGPDSTLRLVSPSASNPGLGL